MRGHGRKETRTSVHARTSGEILRERKEDGRKSVRRGPGSTISAQQCSTTTGCRSVHPSVPSSVRSWTTVHHTGTLPSERRSSDSVGSREAGSFTSQTKMEARVESLTVSRLSLSLSLSLSLGCTGSFKPELTSPVQRVEEIRAAGRIAKI